MTYILEVSEDGSLYLPSTILGKVQPGTRYKLEVQGEKLILHPDRLDEVR
ncbi:MAG: hypothetical protein QNJ63_03080 [Calothrix sp. MO_192.B10]|nr:hypothetical protein [Calothrix sp. MO_192.B10]